MHKTQLVVLGNGMVGHQFIDELCNLIDVNQYDITIFCAESRPAYDRVHLSSYFLTHTAENLLLASTDFYHDRNIRLLLNEPALWIDRQNQNVHGKSGQTVPYEKLIFATGSSPAVPPIKGSDGTNCYVYRTLEDLERIASCAKKCKKGAIVGGGLLGLEAAGALRNLNIETHIVEFAPLLMAEQLDALGGELLRKKIEAMGIFIHTNKNTTEILHHNNGKTMVFTDGSSLDIDFIIFATGIRPQDHLAKKCSLQIGKRGGIAINQFCQSLNDPNIYAIGECASWNETIYGLVAPGYRMAKIAARHILGQTDDSFTDADMSAKLKLIGVDVGSIGDAKGKTPQARSYLYLNEQKEIYKRLIVSEDNKKLLGAVLVGDTTDYGNLLQLMLNAIDLPENPDALILPTSNGEKPVIGIDALPESAPLCSCMDVTKGQILQAIQKGNHTIEDIKATTKAGTGCGGCLPLITQMLKVELGKQGLDITNHICEHFPYTRQELYHIILVGKIKSFHDLLHTYGSGYGCEICKPTIGSLLASCWNDFVLQPDLLPLQDSNDRFLGNIQKDGTYSIVPRSPGGEITPDELEAIAKVAKRYHLYSKITGSQRIALFGAHLQDLPHIWQCLIDAGMETGHAYAKGLRMAKTCVGNSWCRYGVGDSTGLGIEIENRYKGIRTPHKLKIGVSGCTRECAEAQAKDIGLIATEKGWNLYVCGNGGTSPRHAVLLASNLDKETILLYLDRLIMFYIRTADKLQRTASWIDSLEGGIHYIRNVIIDDALKLNQHLEQAMTALRASYQCEWAKVLAHPKHQKHFQHFINSPRPDNYIQMIPERKQHKPAPPQKDTVESYRSPQ
ncbi:Nitrite reductase [NAD(P)H] [Commensalibacter sp. Nvir]|uniref:nitrite reductase large subunit NirB n=1 Tax=Commensalibacter sp. Nvir TaxID=3069817 RepID=UPI002D70E052|nr:Nitrite reductase [NAD(P)H] [Commensalibacter sp. Nvir]